MHVANCFHSFNSDPVKYVENVFRLRKSREFYFNNTFSKCFQAKPWAYEADYSNTRWCKYLHVF